MKRGTWLLAAALVCPGVALAQDAAGQLAAARHHLERLELDSAAAVLRRVSTSRATAEERATAAVLVGVRHLILGQEPAARAAFRDALALDPATRVDALEPLHSDLRRVFGALRASLLITETVLPRDTLVDADTGIVTMIVRASRGVAAALTVTPIGDSVAVFHDSLLVAEGGGAGAVFWRPGAAGPAATGRFVLRATVVERGGDNTRRQDTVRIARAIEVQRLAVDTEPLPAPLSPAALVPEFTQTQSRRPRVLVTGLAFGAAAAALAGGDGRAYVVGGALSLGGLLGYVRGGTRSVAIPENVSHNRQLREADAARRAAVAQSNAERRARAPLRIIVTEAQP